MSSTFTFSRECLHCGKAFTAKRFDKRYCGDLCRATAWQLRSTEQLRERRERKRYGDILEDIDRAQTEKQS